MREAWHFLHKGQPSHSYRAESANKAGPFCGESEEWLFFRAFCFCQCWQMVLLTLTSQPRSFVISSTSAVAKYLVEFGEGLPSGLSIRALTSAGMSCGWQFNTQPACSAVRRAGSCPKSDRNRACSSFMQNQAWAVQETEQTLRLV